jgi:hypothetical protein
MVAGQVLLRGHDKPDRLLLSDSFAVLGEQARFLFLNLLFRALNRFGECRGCTKCLQQCE